MPGIGAAFWRGRRVLLTGHTGFKGSWASLLLRRMGAEVTGIALPPDTDPSVYRLARVDTDVASNLIDLRDRTATASAVTTCSPQIVLHMAAQPLVRRAARQPVETVETNVMGTVHLLDALRGVSGVQAILVVTTDKVYREASRGGMPFHEDDQLGGSEPYSASKAAAEIVTRAFGDSYFEPMGIPVATARGGNVLGGGDFAEDRLVPDIVRAVQSNVEVVLRHPNATRPWQYVLDCVGGYLCYLEQLLGGRPIPRALNFGPPPGASTSVAQIAEQVIAAFDAKRGWRHAGEAGTKETEFLELDTSLARRVLPWTDRYIGTEVIEQTVMWYREFQRGADMRAVTMAQIEGYLRLSAGPVP